MKAYRIKITLRNSNPLIWRRIIVPAEITFKRLHDVIQVAMGWRNYHLYDFNIKEENLRVTCDEEAIAEYDFYSKIKLTKANDPQGYIAKLLEIKPKLSDKIKIDRYLTDYKAVEYIYDFGDYWKHSILLEEIVEDYEYAYPICLDGEGACPPEDVGGILEYEEFLDIMKDEKHPEHKKLKEWASNNYYKETFDINDINHRMANELK
jgi:hypothetical protein